MSHSIVVLLVAAVAGAQSYEGESSGGLGSGVGTAGAGYVSALFPEGERLTFCDNVEVEATQKGVRVELLLQPFGLICVMADVLSGGVLGTYLEDGLLSWKLKSAETLEGMGVLGKQVME
eukprot:GHVN01052251.1.p1 GENE.GHVN01052251.1~~GHVN01052251.1.p1  ORF type:complete len:120 (+),score=15.90 GHVN01052251.1:44-403(+)